MTDSNALYIPDEIDCRTCNICVGNCPTFKISRDSNESPRGRLKLISKVFHNEESLTEEELSHLKSCVECRACESVCPSKMKYSKLLNTSLNRIEETEISPLIRALLYVTSDRKRLVQLFSTLRQSQRWGLQTLAKRLGLFKVAIPEQLNDLLPTIPKIEKFQERYPAKGKRLGSVGLFTGCLSSVLDSPTLKASIKVVNHLGYDVHIPKAQQCCGALHQHNNDKPTADKLAETNIAAFKALDIEAVLFTASGCGTPLKKYPRRKLTELTKENAEEFSSKATDINEFIAGKLEHAKLKLMSLNKKVAVHEPCSQRFPLGTQQYAHTFLEKIPGIELFPLPENNICCGAGGSYMITHPENSDAIRQLKINALEETQADILVTSNIGCSLHLVSGIKKDNKQVTVAHPVEILAQQLS